MNDADYWDNVFKLYKLETGQECPHAWAAMCYFAAKEERQKQQPSIIEQIFGKPELF